MTGLLNARRERRVADAVIRDPEEHTVMDEHGAVRSIQAADVTVPADELDKRWNATHLERLARTYWKYLSRVTLGLIRVTYTEDGARGRAARSARSCCCASRAPEYDVAPTAGVVRWRIQRRPARLASAAATATATSRSTCAACPPEEEGWATVHVEVEVASFYPAIATWLTKFVYSHTQSRIHVLVTHGFLRSLARLDLEESAVGRFAEPQRGVRQEKRRRGHRRRHAVGGRSPALAAAAAACVVALALWLTRD